MLNEHQVFIAVLDKAIEFHRSNQNDPNNIGNAVMVALIEVRECYIKAFGDK